MRQPQFRLDLPNGAYRSDVGIGGRAGVKSGVIAQGNNRRGSHYEHLASVTEFLMRHGGRRFCAECVARAVRVRNVAAARRAMKALASDADYRVEEGDCSRCERTALTIRALWMGM